MKCYNHPDKESVGICSKCDKAVCPLCVETTTRKLICKDCIQESTSPSRHKPYILVSIFLGLLGAVNSLAIGFYVTSTYFSPLFSADLLPNGYIAMVVTTLCAALLVYGSHLMWKGNPRTGGAINLLAAATLTLLYIYFALLTRPQILAWLGLTGYLLLLPPILSAITANLIKAFK